MVKVAIKNDKVFITCISVGGVHDTQSEKLEL